MNDAPLVSVVIPTYNRAHLIGQTIESVRNQTFENFEIVVVDDGSTDKTEEVVCHYKDERIKYFRQPTNVGPSEAKNIGILCSRGEYLALLDSDDLWLPEKLEQQIVILQKNTGSVWIYCDSAYFDDQSGRVTHLSSQRFHPYEGYIPHRLIMQTIMHTPTVVVKRSIIEQIGPFIGNAFEDWRMWLHIAASWPVLYIDRPLVLVRIHSNSISKNSDNMEIFKCRVNAIQAAVEFSPEVYSKWENRALSRVYRQTGIMFTEHNSMKEARSMFFQAIRYYPLNLKPYFWAILTYLGSSYYSSIYSIYRRLKQLLLH